MPGIDRFIEPLQPKTEGHSRRLERKPQIRYACGPVVEIFGQRGTTRTAEGSARGGGGHDTSFFVCKVDNKVLYIFFVIL